MKIPKWLLVLFGILVVVVAAVPIADRILWSASMPARFVDARWVGSWESEAYWPVSGRLLARMPDPIPRDREFEVEVLVYYNLWSPFRPGGSVPMTFVGFFPSEGAGSGESASAVPTLKMTFKGGSGFSVQTVQYVGVVNPMTTAIAGGYTSEAPDDIGGFVLVKH